MNISSKLGIVTVLGTSFEVDESNDSICVVVETGLVRLISASDNSISIDLKELESATLTGTSNTIDRKSVANLNHLYWATQKIVYRQALLPNIFEELSEIFGKSIDYDSSTIQNCRMTAIFNNQTFEEILQNMALSMDFEYSIDSNQVTIKSGGCEDL